MSKNNSRFICQECGAFSPKWMGQCDICKNWNCLIEEPQNNDDSKVSVPNDFFVNVTDRIDTTTARHITKLNELNRVLGGGFVDGSVVLIGGAPGIGKSTLLLQILAGITEIDNYIYISAEESVKQVMLRAKRLSINNSVLRIASSSNIHQILKAIENIRHNSIVVIDSIQTVFSDLIQSSLGSISQVRFCTQELVNFAKSNDVIVVIVGHVTKDGALAGPKTLEHMVDCVLYFEGEKSFDYRILRCEKNRYGSTDEIGVFQMTEAGLQEISNTSYMFLSETDKNATGVAVFAGIEGSRAILSEIQALVSATYNPAPKRSAIGFDPYRLSMLIAVLSTRCKLNFSNKDVFLNVAGGLKISDPSIDLAAVAAIMSSFFHKPLQRDTVYFGEVCLSGSVRQSPLCFQRIREAQKLGYKQVVCNASDNSISKCDIEVVNCKSVSNLF